MEYAGTPIEDGKDCSDGKTHCPDGETCCKADEGGYGCCPYLDAVCCKHNFCCPPAMTCCGQSFCCPVPNAVCCKDGRSCCPHGTQCVPGGCDQIPHFLPMLMGLPEVNNMEKVQSCT